MLKLRSIFKILIIFIFIFLFIRFVLHAESFQIIFYSNTLTDTNTVKSKNISELLNKNIIDNLQNFLFTSSFYNNEFNYKYKPNFEILTPKIFKNNSISDSLNYQNHDFIVSNIKIINDSFALKTESKKIITLKDTTKIGFMGLIKPDFPLLYPKISKYLSFRYDIFAVTDEIISEFEDKEVDIIIAVNFMDEYLNFQLLKKFPQIDYIFDTNIKGKNDYSREQSLKHKLHYIDINEPIIRIYRIYYSKQPFFNVDSLNIISN